MRQMLQAFISDKAYLPQIIGRGTGNWENLLFGSGSSLYRMLVTTWYVLC